MDLPEVEVIGLQPVERLLEHAEGKILVAAMAANLRHQENPVAFAFESPAHPDFRLAAMVLPAVIKECDAAIDGTSHNFFRRFLVGRIAQVMAA